MVFLSQKEENFEKFLGMSFADKVISFVKTGILT